MASIFALNPAAFALNLTKSMAHYAADMEFYYQKPRLEIVPGLLKAMDNGGALAHGENRLMLAAFLAELVRAGKLDLRDLQQAATGKNARQVLGWSAHLAKMPDEKNFLEGMLGIADSTLIKQISSSPAPLEKWPLLSEKTVLQMYWAAFMASGNPDWLDRIIDAAFHYARDRDTGMRHDTAYKVGAAAAASLYEFAPGHRLVVERLKARFRDSSGPEREILSIILRRIKDQELYEQAR